MERYLTLLGIIFAVLAAVFQLVGFLPTAILYILIGAVILIGIGSISGK